jgi:hypothetical protein
MENAMKILTADKFKTWLQSYCKASKDNDPKASDELFALDAKYYESPFDKPLIGRDAIHQYWEDGVQTLKDKSSSFEVLAVKDNLGIAQWQSNFTIIQSGKRVLLDCLFLVEFDEDEKCSLFREWWHRQEIDSSPNNNFGQAEIA